MSQPRLSRRSAGIVAANDKGNVDIEDALLAILDGSTAGDILVKAKDTIFANSADFWSPHDITLTALIVDDATATENTGTHSCP